MQMGKTQTSLGSMQLNQFLYILLSTVMAVRHLQRRAYIMFFVCFINETPVLFIV